MNSPQKQCLTFPMHHLVLSRPSAQFLANSLQQHLFVTNKKLSITVNNAYFCQYTLQTCAPIHRKKMCRFVERYTARENKKIRVFFITPCTLTCSRNISCFKKIFHFSLHWGSLHKRRSGPAVVFHWALPDRNIRNFLVSIYWLGLNF